MYLLEAMHRFCLECKTSISIYARGQDLSQISHMETGDIHTIWVLYNVYDLYQHYYSNDEGRHTNLFTRVYQFAKKVTPKHG